MQQRAGVGALKWRIIGQFLVILLPVLGLLGYQTVTDHGRAVTLEAAFAKRDLALKARDTYAVFTNGVVDAVDSGKLGAKAAESLAEAAKWADALRTLDPERIGADLPAEIAALSDAVLRDANIKALLALRERVARADKAVAAHLAHYESEASAAVVRSTAAAARQQIVVPVAALFAIAMTVLFIWRTIVSLTRPLERAVRAARLVADGDVTAAAQLDTRQDLGGLLASMRLMSGRLGMFIDGQREMARRHREGETGYVLDVSQLPGAFASIAANLNDIVGMHVNVTHRAVAVVGNYAAGDFSAEMDRLPGQQGAITAAVDSVKASLQSLHREIACLIDAARAGRLDDRADESRFAHGFRDMVHGINQIVGTTSESVRAVGQVMAGIAAGDLTPRVSCDFQGEFDTLARNTNATADRLTGIVRDLRGASDAISRAATGIASGNRDLSARSEVQTQNVERMLGAIRQITTSVERNAVNAKAASSLAVDASRIAREGGQIVNDVVRDMTRITEGSRQVVDIISVIDSIAFQTNILALNAAVEAARAGDQGRGFAVVAAEVRNLAQRSAEAAREVSALIGDSSSRITAGARNADQAGQTMQRIVEAAEKVDRIVGEIAVGSQAQATDILAVERLTQEVEQNTQRDTALVQQAASAATALEAEAQQLAGLVATFNVGRHPSMPERSLRPAA